MKKFLLPILIMAMVSLVSCGGDDSDTPTPPEQKSLKLTKIINKTKSFSGKDKEEEEEDVLTFIYGVNGYVSKVVVSGKYYSETEFIYNDKNQLVKQIEVERDNIGTLKVVDIYVFTYNDKGLLVSDINDEGYKDTYEYNSKNLMVKITSYKNNEQRGVVSYEYDSNGNLTKLIRGNYIRNYTFDDKKNPWATILPKGFRVVAPTDYGQHNLLSKMNGADKYIYTYTYNDEGYPIKQEEKYYSSGGQLSEIETTEYFYE